MRCYFVFFFSTLFNFYSKVVTFALFAFKSKLKSAPVHKTARLLIWRHFVTCIFFIFLFTFPSLWRINIFILSFISCFLSFVPLSHSTDEYQDLFGEENLQDLVRCRIWYAASHVTPHILNTLWVKLNTEVSLCGRDTWDRWDTHDLDTLMWYKCEPNFEPFIFQRFIH